MSPDPAAGKAETAAEAQNCWVFISKGAGHFLVCKITGWLWPRKVLGAVGAVMSVVLLGPMNRCANCRRIPPEGQRWPHVADGDRFCSLDCLYGLHPELEEGGQ